MEEVRRWMFVEVKREERKMVELNKTRDTLEPMDLLVGSEFHEDSTSGQDTLRWIIPYDPSSSEVLLWKGQLIARLMHDAGLSDKETAESSEESESDSDSSSNSGSDKSSGDECNSTMLTGGMKFKSQQDFEEFLNSKSSEEESDDDSDEDEIGCSVKIRQMLAQRVEEIQRENVEEIDEPVGQEQANTLPEGNENDSPDSRLVSSEKDEPAQRIFKPCKVVLERLPSATLAGQKRPAASTIRCNIIIKKYKLNDEQLAGLARENNVKKNGRGQPKKPSNFIGSKCSDPDCGKTVHGEKKQKWHWYYFHSAAVKCQEEDCNWTGTRGKLKNHMQYMHEKPQCPCCREKKIKPFLMTHIAEQHGSIWCGYVTSEVCKCCQELYGSCNCEASQEEQLMPEEEFLTAVATKINLKFVKHNLS